MAEPERMARTSAATRYRSILQLSSWLHESEMDPSLMIR
jgi:hypothetical protein